VIIQDDSALRRLPSELDPRQRLFFDGIGYSIEIADLAYERLYTWVEDATKAMQNGTSTPRTTFRGVIADAWMIVDAVHRLRRLVENMPNLKRGPSIKAFLASTKNVSTIRHRVQHLDEQIHTLASKRLPAWGSVSWFYCPDKSQPRGWVYSLAAGSFELKHVAPSPSGLRSTVPIGLITLTAYEMTVNLSEIIRSVETFAHSFEETIECAHRELTPGGSDVALALEIGWESTEIIA
jgi:hypothetical protein